MTDEATGRLMGSEEVKILKRSLGFDVGQEVCGVPSLHDKLSVGWPCSLRSLFDADRRMLD
jgi:hypothetical protein